MENVEKLQPRAFTKFCMSIGAVPSSYLAGLSTEEQLLWFCSYLQNEVIPAVNNNGGAVEELQALYIELKNYVDNLDLQDEVDNKLDEMVEDGTFDRIINQEVLSSINQQISNLQTQQGQIQNDVTSLTLNVNSNTNKINTNEERIGNLSSTKANNTDLLNFINTTNLALERQYDIIGNLQGGTPTVVTNTNQMVDQSKIYVLTTDGNWYYYNGTAFVSGGVYQATEFAKDSISDLAIANVDYSKTQCIPLVSELKTATWNGATVVSRVGTSIQINTSTGTSDNSGVFIIDFNDTNVDKTKDIVLTANCTGIEYVVYLFNGSTFVEGLYTAVKSDNRDLYLKIKASKFTGLANPRLLVASSQRGMLYINNLTVTYYNNYDYKQKNLIDKIDEISPLYTNIKDDTMQTDILDWTEGVFGSGVKIQRQSPYSFSLIDSGSAGASKGISSPLLTRTDKKLVIEFDVQNVSQETFNFNLYIAKSNSVFAGVGGTSLVQNNHFKIVVDVPYYVVYQDYDQYYIWIMMAQPGRIDITNFKFYYSDISELSIYDTNFNEVLKNIDSKLSSSSSIKNDISYINSASKKYLIQANDSGNLQLVNVIPNKTLFIGNSLLLGNHHGDYAFGMCATNINNDYYHHISSYITERDETATFDKISGTDFEGATNQTTVNNYFNTLLPKLNNNLELVIVQLGDNVNTPEKLTMFNTSCLQLLQFIRTHALNARVVYVGEWYSTAEKQNIIANACKNSGCQFVDISMLNKPENQASIGTVITYPDGYTETVTSGGVASHPSNLGFENIANKIINEIF